MRPLFTVGGVATAVLLAFAAAAASPSAAAGGPVAGLGHIVAPADDGAASTSGGGLVVRLRLAPGARVTGMRVNGSPVTVRASVTGRTATVHLPARRPLTPGTNVLLVRLAAPGRHGFATSRFILVRPARGLVRVTSPAAGSTRPAGPVTLTLAGRPGGSVTLLVNGTPATSRLRAGRPGSWTAVLTPAVGLRHGVNRVRVRAVHPSGLIEVVDRTFAVSAAGPLADAGPDLRTTAGLAVRLDGRASRPAPGTGPLRNAWTVVAAPRGAAPRLTGARAARPVLHTRVPGRYVLRHTVTGSTGGGGGARQAAVASSSDTVAVQATTPEPLAPVTVTGGATPGVTVGSAQVPAGIPGPGVQLVVLDRATLAVEPTSASFPAGSMDDLQSAVAALVASNAGTGDDIALLVSLPLRGGSAVTSAADAASLQAAVAALGGTAVDPSQAFGVVGVPGSTTAGTAWQVPVELDGYFTPDINGNWTFVFGRERRFDTGTDSPTTGNTITVGDRSFSVRAPSSGQGGFQVVLLDQFHPDDASCFYFTTNDPSSTATCTTSPPAPNPASPGIPFCAPDIPSPCIAPPVCNGPGCPPAIDTPALSMGATIQGAVDAGQVVIVRSIGSPFPSSPSPALIYGPQAVLPAIQAAGGTVSIFSQLGPGQTYVLVSPSTAGKVPVEASSVPGPPMPASGRVTGTLGRAGPDGGYAPVAADTTGAVDFSDTITAISLRPPVDWPYSSTAGQQAALQYISKRLHLGCDAAGVCDVRRTYANVGFDVSGYSTKLEGYAYPGGTAFTAQDFSDVKGQLLKEFPMVGSVWGLIGFLQAPYAFSGAGELAELQQLAGDVETAVNPPQANATANIFGFITDFLWGMSLADDPLAEVAGQAAVAAAFGAQIAATQNGAVALQIQEQAAELATGLLTQAEDAGTGIGNLGEIIVADWDKLRTVSDRAANRWAQRPDTQADIADAIQARGLQTFYTSLMPVAYTAYQVPVTSLTPSPAAANFGCTLGEDYLTPFAGIAVSAQIVVAAVTPTTANAYAPSALTYPVYALSEAGQSPFSGSPQPPASLTDPIFAALSPGTLNGGFQPGQWFWDLAFPDPVPPAKWVCPT